MTTGERRVFGQRPQTTELALKNLPDENHPLFDSDLSIEHLASLRRVLVQSILHYLDISPFPIPPFPPSLVENKMVPLTDEDVMLMEQYSFSRSKIVGVEPFRASETKEGRLWKALFPPEKDSWISVWTMSPWDLSDFPLVLIEIHEPDDSEFPFTMGVVTPEEYETLSQEVDGVLYDLACKRAVRRRRIIQNGTDSSRY